MLFYVSECYLEYITSAHIRTGRKSYFVRTRTLLRQLFHCISRYFRRDLMLIKSVTRCLMLIIIDELLDDLSNVRALSVYNRLISFLPITKACEQL